MKIVARQPSPGTFLLEFFPERVQTASPYVKLAYAQLFGKEEWAATVTWSAIGPVDGSAALEFGSAVRAAAYTAHDLAAGKVTIEKLLILWGPLPVPQTATP